MVKPCRGTDMTLQGSSSLICISKARFPQGGSHGRAVQQNITHLAAHVLQDTDHTLGLAVGQVDALSDPLAALLSGDLARGGTWTGREKCLSAMSITLVKKRTTESITSECKKDVTKEVCYGCKCAWI